MEATINRLGRAMRVIFGPAPRFPPAGLPPWSMPLRAREGETEGPRMWVRGWEGVPRGCCGSSREVPAYPKGMSWHEGTRVFGVALPLLRLHE